MRIKSNDDLMVKAEPDLFQTLLDFKGKVVVELGCGDGSNSRHIAGSYPNCQVIAFEVDTVQLSRNRSENILPNLTFKNGGAEDIALADGYADIVMMFKSLHHVPVDAMDRAVTEISRILRPDGLLYVSEPVFAGAFNEVIRLFHDEQSVREAAFSAEQRAVNEGLFELVAQEFFLTAQRFEDFSEFERRLIGATYANHQLDDATHREVERRFMAHMTDDGAHFQSPMRVDILRAVA